ncbi:MAG: hypothetical protein QE271_00435 [Bacteriovoracaceae bacterium]|nr:hypothetical protein [Bacteriovoracaceae bacterium]
MENKTILAGAIQAVEFEGINHCSRENPKLEMVGFGFVNEVIILKSIVRCERYKIVFKLKTNRNDLMYPKPVKLTSVRIKKS